MPKNNKSRQKQTNRDQLLFRRHYTFQEIIYIYNVKFIYRKYLFYFKEIKFSYDTV